MNPKSKGRVLLEAQNVEELLRSESTTQLSKRFNIPLSTISVVLTNQLKAQKLKALEDFQGTADCSTAGFLGAWMGSIERQALLNYKKIIT